MSTSTSGDFSLASDMSQVEKDEWDSKYAEITVDGNPVTLAELASFKKANFIFAQSVENDIKLADDLVVKHILLMGCGGDIILGKNTKAGAIQFDGCWGVKSVVENVRARSLMVCKCDAFEKIGSGLIINEEGEWDGNGCTGVHVSECPAFQTFEGPAYIDGFISIFNTPLFKGLSPEITQNEQYSCRHLGYPPQRLNEDRTDEARAYFRELWAKNNPAIGLELSPQL